MAKIIISVFIRVANIVEKGENAGKEIFRNIHISVEEIISSPESCLIYLRIHSAYLG